MRHARRVEQELQVQMIGALIGSPLLGGAAWEPMAELLCASTPPQPIFSGRA